MLVESDFEFSSLPTTVEHRRTFAVGFFTLVAAIGMFLSFIGGVGYLIQLQGGARQADGIGILLALIFVVCMLVVLRALDHSYASATTRLDSKEVWFRSKRLWRSEEWKTPLAEFTGIERRDVGDEYLDFHIILQHPERQKSLVLFRTGDVARSRLIWKRYAQLLKMPAVERSGGREHRIEYTDLEKSALEVEDGDKIVSASALERSLPSGVELRSVRLEQVVTITKPSVTYFPGLIACFMCGASLYAGVQSGDFSSALVSFPLLGIFGGWYVFGALARYQLILGPIGVDFRRESPWGTKGLGFIPYSNLQRIEVEPATRFYSALKFVSDELEVSIANRLSGESRRWLREYVLAQMNQRRT